MPNTIAIEDWLRVIDEEYLSTFVRDGGASVKFAVTPDESRDDLYTKVRARCLDLDHFIVQFNSATDRAHMPQDFFFSLARQVDWRLLARRMILRLGQNAGLRVGGVDSRETDNIYGAIAQANGLDLQSVYGDLRPHIETTISKNSNMAKDFRVAMTQLCVCENTSRQQEYNGQPLLDWLNGNNNRISSVRPFLIHTGINRNTARYFIESALYWIRHVGHAGTVILFDNSRVTVARNPKDGLRYYTRAMAMEHYELLREFIDGVDRLAGALLVVVTNQDFLEDGSDRRSRGYGIYQALRTRVMDDVRDRNRVNPIASLVRLS